MEITKGSRALYNFLEKVFKFVKKDYVGSVVYVTENHEITYKSGNVFGLFKLVQNDVNQLQELEEGVYEIQLLFDGTIRLEKFKGKVDESMETSIKAIPVALSAQEYVCDFDDNDYAKL